MGGAGAVEKPSPVGAAEHIDRCNVQAGLLKIAYYSL
jgi:hypothetical protein